MTFQPVGSIGSTTPPKDVQTKTDDVQGTLGAKVLNPIEDPSVYDYFTLDGARSPGLCAEIAGASNPRKWDERAGTGITGATIVYMGDGLCKFSVKLLFWLPIHFDEWEAFKPKLKSPTKKRPNALDIYHPYLDLLPSPVKAVVVTDVKSPVQTEPGFWEVVIEFLQYRMPKPAGALPKGSSPPKDAVDQMIDDNNKTINDLNK